MNTKFFCLPRYVFSEHDSRTGKLKSPEAKAAYYDIMNADGQGWPLPADRVRLATYLGYSLEAIDELLDRLGFLFTVENERLHHLSVIEARQKAADISAKRSAAGKRGMQSRWGDSNCNNKLDNKPSNGVGTDTGVNGVLVPASNLENTLTSENETIAIANAREADQ